MVTQTPDYFQPATSCVLHGKLALNNDCAAFDVNLGCSGYVYGLWISSMMICCSNAERVLLLAGDTLSRCVSQRDRAILPLFGDAGSATVVEKGADDEEINFVMHSDGMGCKHLLIPAGGFRNRPSEETAKIKEYGKGLARSQEHLYMNGAEIFNFSIREVPPLIKEILLASNWKIEEIEYFLFHQANKFIISNIIRKLHIPIEKAPYGVFKKYGNQSSASIPAVICEDLNSEIRDTSKKVILAGFGSGLSWAACALELGPILCNPVIFSNGT
jgi:3-oxoacyl-[acyl-carrier-protein] synthase-3